MLSPVVMSWKAPAVYNAALSAYSVGLMYPRLWPAYWHAMAVKAVVRARRHTWSLWLELSCLRLWLED